MHKALLVTLFAAFAIAQETPVRLNKSLASKLVAAQSSVQASIRDDPVWSSIYSIMTTATGKEGAAATFIRDQGSVSDKPIFTASGQAAEYLASIQSKYSSIVTELPSEAYSAYKSVVAINLSIMSSIYSEVSAEASLTASGSASKATGASTPIITPTVTPTISATQSVSSLIAATTSPAVVPTGGAERMQQLGCVAAIGVLGAAAILL